MSAAPQEAPLLPGKLRNARALWIVLIIMAFLAGCALLFARGSLRLSGDWQSQLSNTLTVQVILDSSERWAEQTDLARTTLNDTFPSADIEVLSQDEAKDLLRPWLGNATLPESLPIPALLNVVGEELSIAEAQSALDAAGLSTNIDDNTRYADSLSGTTRRLVGISLATLLLVLLAGISVNVFATRAGMIAQKEIIRVLVQVGASDKFIAKLFVTQALRRGAMGALIGLGLVAMFWLCLSIFGDWGGLGWTGPVAGLSDIIWLVGLGLLFAIICAAAAGLTATQQLAFERKRL